MHRENATGVANTVPGERDGSGKYSARGTQIQCQGNAMGVANTVPGERDGSGKYSARGSLRAQQPLLFEKSIFQKEAVQVL